MEKKTYLDGSLRIFYKLVDFLVIIIDDRLVGSIRLFSMIDDKMSADFHHYKESLNNFQEYRQSK